MTVFGHFQEALKVARRDDAETLSSLLPNSVDGPQTPASNGIFIGGERALYVAAVLGHTAAVEMLLHRRANPNMQRRDGRTAQKT